MDINKGIKDLLAAKNIKDSAQLAEIARLCCLQLCHCCLKVVISIEERLGNDVKKVVDPDKFDVE
jgi:hypothetical protein